ncbi:MAG: prepilin-type N-terminal cleavage/methylation domain-containing protein [bacterium]|nr:prepilin-type N-terminal cleavage/methylation domain-containing protein [bacterium]
MRKNIKNTKNRGYTIIETMIAVSLFVIIVLTGTNALLNANLVHQKSQDSRTILDSIGFAMNELSRNLRTAYTYHCFVSADEILPTPLSGLNYPQSCEQGEGISFETDSGDPNDFNDQEIYFLSEGGLWKLVGPYGGAPVPTRLTPEDVILDMDTSGFSVFGAEAPGGGDQEQPLVTIRLSGEIKFRDVATSFSLQTSVSQRIIDI